MKKFTYVLLALVLTLSMMAIGFAQEVVTAPISTNDFFALLMASLGGLKGAGALGIAGIVSKLLLAFSNSELFDKLFSKLAGGVKLTIVLALSLVSGVIALRLTGVDWLASLVHSTTLSAFVVLSNQVYKQYFEKK